MFFLNYSTIIDPLLRNVRLCLVQSSGMKAGDRVLDVCCGTGDQTYYYAGAGINATGIDLDLNMLKLAREDKRKQAMKNASFQRADARHLPFRDSSFDGASTSLALHEKERAARDTIIAEMKRVVRKNGVLFFLDFQVPLPRKWITPLVKSLEFFAGREHHRCFRDYIAQGGLDAILAQNQLAEEERHYLNGGLLTVIKARNSDLG
jgi:ubiquinone/menaquinone biosynthesis C-methylase UbiE